jgi:hypothetical protein
MQYAWVMYFGKLVFAMFTTNSISYFVDKQKYICGVIMEKCIRRGQWNKDIP